jgi:dihydroorotate dehydrogenase (NAD+) catalytic subunit
MERTSIELGGVTLASSVMNASGPHSAEKDEIHELSARHSGAIVFKSCNIGGLDSPDNLKNRGIAHFSALARELSARGKPVIGSVVGNTDDEIVQVATELDRAGAKIIELNLADDYVQNAIAPFATFDRLKALIGRVRGEIGAVLRIAVCANDLPKDLQVDRASGIAEGPARTLSQVHAFYKESEGLLDIVAVGGINGGRDAYIAHLTGAKGLQVGSALIKEGAGALEWIDRELDELLAANGKATVRDIVGQIRFRE